MVAPEIPLLSRLKDDEYSIKINGPSAAMHICKACWVPQLGRTIRRVLEKVYEGVKRGSLDCRQIRAGGGFHSVERIGWEGFWICCFF